MQTNNFSMPLDYTTPLDIAELDNSEEEDCLRELTPAHPEISAEDWEEESHEHPISDGHVLEDTTDILDDDEAQELADEMYCLTQDVWRSAA